MQEKNGLLITGRSMLLMKSMLFWVVMMLVSTNTMKLSRMKDI